MEKMLEERAKLVHELNELNSKKHELEQEIIRKVLETGDTYVLSVNWNRLHRVYGLPPANRML